MPKTTKLATINNRGSESYNIITCDPNLVSGSMSNSQKQHQSHNRLKGVGEIRELLHSSAINTNQSHKKALEQNQKAFTRKEGMFTHLYNSAARFGESRPFKA